MMNQEDVLKEFEECGALLKGHFVLSSGLHSETYLNKSIVSMYPDRTERLCKALAAKLPAFSTPPQYVISPAMGGIIYGYEAARAMGLPFMYTERVDGEFVLRRGFGVPKGASVLIVEDIISTGLSSRECVDAVRKAGGEPLAVACLIDRSGGKADAGVPIVALAALDVPTYQPHDLPPHLANVPAVKPGSRGIQGAS